MNKKPDLSIQPGLTKKLNMYSYSDDNHEILTIIFLIFTSDGSVTRSMTSGAGQSAATRHKDKRVNCWSALSAC